MKKVFLILLIIFSISSVSVIALSLCNAKDIEYNANDNSWDVDTVEDALNDLYQSNGSNINDSCNNVAKPKIDAEGKLIPVILSDDGKATVVSESDPNWYNYCEKKWANVIILNDGVDKQKYQVGYQLTEEDEDEIESYFVWIPKYKYKLWNVYSNGKDAIQQVHSIDIVFDTTNTTDIPGESCVTPMESGKIGDCNNEEYMTHPAFISFGVDGFWVGKFETGYDGTTNNYNVKDASKVIIKPNVLSWRNINVKNMFETAYEYERDLDSHMMKNTEWGAVAYLSHSKYGIDREINLNNNNLYKTGYSSSPTVNQKWYQGTSGDGGIYNQLWNTDVGYLASTTGNITGVYDMSGGAWENMASYRSGTYLNSGFNSETFENAYDDAYYDLYNSNSTLNSFQNMILGDATGEMGPFNLYVVGTSGNDYHNSWYGDPANFINSPGSWFERGGDCTDGVLTGQFRFHAVNGGASNRMGFRLVLVGENKHPTSP